jgi:hypothetical protein
MLLTYDDGLVGNWDDLSLETVSSREDPLWVNDGSPAKVLLQDDGVELEADLVRVLASVMVNNDANDNSEHHNMNG